MKKYRCLTDVFQEVPGNPVKGEIYDVDYTWGIGIVTVEELVKSDPEDWELVSETPQLFSIEAENIHMRKAMIEDLEKIGYKFDGSVIDGSGIENELNIIRPKFRFFDKTYIDNKNDDDVNFIIPLEYTKALEFAKEQLEIFNKEKEPEYVPFTFDDRDIFRDRWVRSKKQDLESRILDIGPNGIRTHYLATDFEEALKLLEFTDGTPFGKLKK